MEHYLKTELYHLIQSDPAIFDFIQHSSLDGLWYWDLDNPENEWMNERFWTLMGYDPAEMPHFASAWQNKINQDDLKTALHNFKEHLKEPKHPYDQIVRYKHKDGSTVWVRCRGMAIMDQNGKAIRMLGAHHDLTELKKVEKALKESEEKYRLITENTSDVIWIYNILEERYTYISPSILHLTGYTTAEATDRSIEETLTHDSARMFKKVIKKRLKEFFKDPDKAVNFIDELKQHHKDGNFIWIETSTKCRFNKDYEVELIGVSRDITDRKNAENALRESEKKYRSLIENTYDLVALLSMDGTFEFVSNNVLSITGFTVEEYKHFSAYENIHPEDRQQVKKVFDQLMQNSEQGIVEYRIKKKNGEYIWLQSRSQKVKDAKGQLKYIMTNSNDISSKKLYEQALITAKEKAESANNKLTASHNKMTQINHKLKKANQELDNFVYRVSHDLRAPIASSLGLAQLTEQTSDLTEIHGFCKLQIESLLKLDKFIKDILNYSRNSRLLIKPEPIDFEEFIDLALKENQFTIEAAHIKIQKCILYQQVFKTDKLRFEIILNNLLSNAIKYQNPYRDEHLVNITISQKDKDAVIEIEDNGIGIDRKYHKMIFEMFFRATDKKPGSGIGLYIVKDALEKINGKIKVSSRLGQGSKFTVTIPFNEGK